MKIKYFAWIKDITNVEEEDIDYNKFNTLNKVKDCLINKYPNLKKHNDKQILRFAVNQEYITENIDLNLNDEIAVFPPVSGG